ncbi:MAG TPA: Hsp33 family molecular chaperone HslO [Blastocatellia bacterium]|jgi:molecular chaperone Hsp33|nr:Hsp33 family molecular chaperone HslO [Blastocatellia bacterium]
MTDQLIHATAADNQLRCVAAVTTNLVGEACRRHRTFPTASVALGRTLTGGLLLGSGLKDLEKITVHFSCDGPIGNIITQADPRGNVRGYVTNPEADATNMNSNGKFDVRAVVGGGTLYVTRDAGFEIGLFKEPYRGSVPIVSGEIGEDLAYYLAKSEQINSAVGIGVLMTVDQTPNGNDDKPEFALDRLRVAAAGGFIVQVMPGAEERLIAQIERNIEQAPHSTEMIRSGLTPFEMLETITGGMELNPLDKRQPRFVCQCSRERALLIISALGRKEVEDMLEKDNGAELTCHFCSESYHLDAGDLRDILAEA